jgi:hypothetical protein
MDVPERQYHLQRQREQRQARDQVQIRSEPVHLYVRTPQAGNQAATARSGDRLTSLEREAAVKSNYGGCDRFSHRWHQKATIGQLFAGWHVMKDMAGKQDGGAEVPTPSARLCLASAAQDLQIGDI